MTQLEEQWLAAGKTIKQVSLPNRNNKRHNAVMMELNLAPEVRIPGLVLDSTVFKITWRQEGEPDVINYYELYDMARMQVSSLCDIICYASHGLPTTDVVQWLINKYKVTPATEISLYIYKKLN